MHSQGSLLPSRYPPIRIRVPPRVCKGRVGKSETGVRSPTPKVSGLAVTSTAKSPGSTSSAVVRMELTEADELDGVSAFGQHSGPYAHLVSCDERNRSVHRAIHPSLCRSSVVYLPNGLRQQGTRCPVRRTARVPGNWSARGRGVRAEWRQPRGRSPRMGGIYPRPAPDPVGSPRGRTSCAER